MRNSSAGQAGADGAGALDRLAASTRPTAIMWCPPAPGPNGEDGRPQAIPEPGGPSGLGSGPEEAGVMAAKLCVVTGTSSGIGRAVAEALLAQEWQVVGVAR